MNSVQKDWFTEQGVLNADQVTLSLKCDKILHKEKSEFQELLVFHRYEKSNRLSQIKAF